MGTGNPQAVAKPQEWQGELSRKNGRWILPLCLFAAQDMLGSMAVSLPGGSKGEGINVLSCWRSLVQAGGCELHPLLVLQGWAHEHLGMQHSPQHPAWCPAGRLPGLFISRQCFLPVESSTLCWFGSQPYWRRKGFSSGSLHSSFQPEPHASFASQFLYIVTLHL